MHLKNTEISLEPKHLKTLEIGHHSTTHTLLLETMPAEDVVDIKAKKVGARGVAKPIINTYLALSPHITTVAKKIT